MASSLSAPQSSSPAAARRQSPTRDNAEDLITYCCVCFLPAASARTGEGDDTEGNPPFWLTSCGHIVCGSHVFPDGVPRGAAKTTHTCPYCSSSGISLADLGASKLEVSLELRDYFRPESDLLEDVAGAIKFRVNNAIRIASHYKALAEKLQGKVDDQRRVLLKVKDELVEGKELKKQKSLMETEIASLREEVSNLRAQLSSAQLSSLDDDGIQLAQRQYRSSTETLQQNSISPVTTVAEVDNQHKRKADDDPAFRAREFRNEINKRQAMPPPALPQSAQGMEQQHPDNRRGQYNEQRQDQDQGQRVDIYSERYSNQSQQLGYPPQRQQIYNNQPVPRDASNRDGGQLAYRSPEQQSLPNEYERHFIDLTEPGGFSTNPPQLNPQGRFVQQQKGGGGNQSRAGYVNNINTPFRSPLGAQIQRPASTLPVRGTRDGYFTPPNQQSPRIGTGYGKTIPQPLQGGNPRYLYERGAQSRPTIPAIPEVTNIGDSSVVSPFFTDPPAPMKNLGLSAVANGIRRPASVASFAGQQGSLSRSYGGGLGDNGFFSRRGNETGGLPVPTEAPDWSTPRLAAGGRGVGTFMRGGEGIKAGVAGGFGGSGRGNIFSPQRGSARDFGSAFRTSISGAVGDGVTDRPGLRRSVRRD